MANSAAGRRLQVSAVLAAFGAVAGAVAAVTLSYLGTKVAQAFEPNGRVYYQWAAGQFAIIGAIGTPLLAWSLMRRVPLWRAVGEPALGGILGTLVSLATIPFLHVMILQPILVLGGILGAALRLRWAHRGSNATRIGPEASASRVETRT